MMKASPNLLVVFSLLFLVSATLVAAECTCERDDLNHASSKTTLKYKIGALVVILVSSALGVCLPIVGRNIPSLRPESNLFFLIKAFAAGVILSTGFIHILPDAFEDLTNPCIKGGPWGDYPFTGLAAMIGSLGTLMIDAFATGHYTRMHFGKKAAEAGIGGSKRVSVDEETSGDHAGHVHLHTHATHGHAHGPVGSVIPTS